MKTKLKQFKRLRKIEVSKTVSKVSKEATLPSLQLCTDPSVVHHKLPEGHIYWSMDHWRYIPLNQVISFKVKLDKPIIDITANPDDLDYDSDETEYKCTAMVNKTSISLLMQYFDDTEEKRQELLDIFAEKPSSPYAVARHLPKGVLKFYEDTNDEYSGEWYYTPDCEESLLCKMNFGLPVWDDEEDCFTKTNLECKGDITETTINIFLKYCDDTEKRRDEVVDTLRAHGSDVDVSIQDLSSEVGCGVFTKNKMGVWCWWLHDYPNLDFNDGEWSVDCDGVWSKKGVAVITLKHILDDDWDISKKLYPSGTLSVLKSLECLRPYVYYDMVEIINKNRSVKFNNFLRDNLNEYDPIMDVIGIEDLASQIGYGTFTQNGKDSIIYWWSKNKGLEYVDDVWKCNNDDVVRIRMEKVGNVKVYDEPVSCTGTLNVQQSLALLGKYKNFYFDDESLLRLKDEPEKYVDLKEGDEKHVELDLDETDIREVVKIIQKDTESRDTKQSGLLLESNGKYTQLDFTNTSDLIDILLNKLGANTSDIVSFLLSNLGADLLIKDNDGWTKINKDKKG